MNIITTDNANLIQKAYERNIRKPFPVHLPAQCAVVLNALGKLSALSLSKKYKGGKVTDDHLKKALANIISLCIVMMNKLDKKNKVKVVVPIINEEISKLHE